MASSPHMVQTIRCYFVVIYVQPCSGLLAFLWCIILCWLNRHHLLILVNTWKWSNSTPQLCLIWSNVGFAVTWGFHLWPKIISGSVNACCMRPTQSMNAVPFLVVTFRKIYVLLCRYKYAWIQRCIKYCTVYIAQHDPVVHFCQTIISGKNDLYQWSTSFSFWIYMNICIFIRTYFPTHMHLHPTSPSKFTPFCLGGLVRPKTICLFLLGRFLFREQIWVIIEFRSSQLRPSQMGTQ